MNVWASKPSMAMVLSGKRSGPYRRVCLRFPFLLSQVDSLPGSPVSGFEVLSLSIGPTTSQPNQVPIPAPIKPPTIVPAPGKTRVPTSAPAAHRAALQSAAVLYRSDTGTRALRDRVGLFTVKTMLIHDQRSLWIPTQYLHLHNSIHHKIQPPPRL